MCFGEEGGYLQGDASYGLTQEEEAPIVAANRRASFASGDPSPSSQHGSPRRASLVGGEISPQGMPIGGYSDAVLIPAYESQITELREELTASKSMITAWETTIAEMSTELRNRAQGEAHAKEKEAQAQAMAYNAREEAKKLKHELDSVKSNGLGGGESSGELNARIQDLENEKTALLKQQAELLEQLECNSPKSECGGVVTPTLADSHRPPSPTNNPRPAPILTSPKIEADSTSSQEKILPEAPVGELPPGWEKGYDEALGRSQIRPKILTLEKVI